MGLAGCNGNRLVQLSRTSNTERREREDVREVPRLRESQAKNTDRDHFEPSATGQQAEDGTGHGSMENSRQWAILPTSDFKETKK